MEDAKREQSMAYGRRIAFGVFFALATWFVVSSTWQITAFALGSRGRAAERTPQAAPIPSSEPLPSAAYKESPHAPQ